MVRQFQLHVTIESSCLKDVNVSNKLYIKTWPLFAEKCEEQFKSSSQYLVIKIIAVDLENIVRLKCLATKFVKLTRL